MGTTGEENRRAQEEAMMRQVAMQAAQQRAQERAYQRSEANLDARGKTQLAAIQEQGKTAIDLARIQAGATADSEKQRFHDAIEVAKFNRTLTPEQLEDRAADPKRRLANAWGGQPAAAPEMPLQTAAAPLAARPKQPLPGDPNFRAWYKSKYGPGAEPSGSDIYDPNNTVNLRERINFIQAGSLTDDESIREEYARQGVEVDPSDDYAVGAGIENDDFYGANVADKGSTTPGMSIQGPDGRWYQIAKPGRDRSPVEAVKAAMMPTSPSPGVTGEGAAASTGVPTAAPAAAAPATLMADVAGGPPGMTLGEYDSLLMQTTGKPSQYTQDLREGKGYDRDKARRKDEAIEGETIAQAKGTLERLAAHPSLTPVGQQRWDKAMAVLAQHGLPSFQYTQPSPTGAEEMSRPLLDAFDKAASERAGGLSYSSEDDLVALQIEARAIEKKMRDAGYPQEDIDDALLAIKRAATKSDMPFGWGSGRFSNEEANRIAYSKQSWDGSP